MTGSVFMPAYNRTIFVLRQVRDGIERERAVVPVGDVERGEEFAEALESVDTAIVAEMLALSGASA